MTKNKKPQLSFWQIWNMSFGFLGIQFGFALQNANVSRIFETLGANIEDIPILWIAAPVTGLLIQPIIGHMSDKTWGRLGRRRPYFLIGAIFASLALFIMPNSPALWIAAGMLWIMDASINISMEPFRAFVGDMLPPEQRTRGFAMQSFFIGTGAVIASALPYIMTNWLGIENTAPEGEIAPSVKFSFYIGALIFILAVAWTVFRTKEYSPEELEAFEDYDSENISNDEIQEINNKKSAQICFKSGGILLALGIIVTIILYFTVVKKEVYILGFGMMIFGLVEIVAGILQKSKASDSGLVSIMNDLNNMPTTMKQLAFVQFFSWFALFAMWIYSTSAITNHVYGTSDTTSALYNEGADWVGILFAVYNGFAAVFAFLLIYLARKTNRKITHMISLLVGGVSFISVFFISDPILLVIPFIGIGLVWASILSMPYAILTGSLPAKKMGVYMGIFNFFIVIPQIVAASILGFFVKNLFDEKAIYALILGGISLFIASALVMIVKDKN
ncbi:MAG: MFS transporter [Bacteroidetes bacterium]|jgi:maltose/moltooligosaccharide transporter|nr:MFS transporter [Bacteroidota bacterium]MBT6687444.1 MFS transporter [Bacteroidota bacterium]MBT7143364.1 MFS transporter [Bacteroidota bacterium]MBT7491638.1 MFS transporter [Bacteroidota bacterium]